MRLRAATLALATSALAVPLASTATPASAAYLKNPKCKIDRTIAVSREKFIIKCESFKPHTKLYFRLFSRTNGLPYHNEGRVRGIVTNQYGIVTLGARRITPGLLRFRMQGPDRSGHLTNKSVLVTITKP